MNNKDLLVLTRNKQTGVLDKTVISKPEDLALAGSRAVPRPVRVLVADDCETDRELTVRHLGEAWPFERDMLVECAADGKEALEKFRRSRFALAVLDWNIPHISGGDVLRTMRNSGVRIPVVVVSSERRQNIANDLTAMAAAYVHKDELNPTSFSSAIAVSLQLQGVEWTATRLHPSPGV